MRMRPAVPAAAATLALFAMAAGAAHAQAPELLNSLEVQRLVHGDQPADHVGLRDHFLALAVRYDAEARRQTATARAMAGNPNHPIAWTGARATRLATSARASAALVRELAVYHERLAAGVPARAPAGAGEFHHGKGAPPPTDRAARELAATARSRADHRVMEEYFATVAARHRDDAAEHVRRGRLYRVQVNGRVSDQVALVCDVMAHAARRAAARAEARALVHRQLADLVGTD